MQAVFLKPGDLHVATSPTIIRTILGSCVAVCLMDAQRGIAGMNHYVHPRPFAQDSHSNEYGTIAIQALIRQMQDGGGKISRMTAQLFGGAQQSGGTIMNIGAENITLAREMLEQVSIPVIFEHVGGAHGRKLLFDTGIGRVRYQWVKSQFLRSVAGA
jgi:chemotaxis protein CheD